MRKSVSSLSPWLIESAFLYVCSLSFLGTSLCPNVLSSVYKDTSHTGLWSCLCDFILKLIKDFLLKPYLHSEALGEGGDYYNTTTYEFWGLNSLVRNIP